MCACVLFLLEKVGMIYSDCANRTKNSVIIAGIKVIASNTTMAHKMATVMPRREYD